MEITWQFSLYIQAMVIKSYYWLCIHICVCSMMYVFTTLTAFLISLLSSPWWVSPWSAVETWCCWWMGEWSFHASSLHSISNLQRKTSLLMCHAPCHPDTSTSITACTWYVATIIGTSHQFKIIYTCTYARASMCQIWSANLNTIGRHFTKFNVRPL